jgi:hypothetical protein
MASERQMSSTHGLRSCVLLLAAALATRSIAPAHAEAPPQVCARVGTDDTLRPITTDLVPTINALFHTTTPPQMAVDTTVFRCAGGRVMVCATGANLPCGKADTSRSNIGATAWCRDHPDAAFIPAYASGHATIFDWRCQNGVAAIVRQRYKVDPRGFVAAYWKVLPQTQAARPSP